MGVGDFREERVEQRMKMRNLGEGKTRETGDEDKDGNGRGERRSDKLPLIKRQHVFCLAE